MSSEFRFKWSIFWIDTRDAHTKRARYVSINGFTI